MGGLTRALFGEKGTPSRVVDSTPDEFARLRGPLASSMATQLRGQNGYQGPFVAGMTPGEMQGLQGVQQAASGVGQNPLAMQLMAGATGFNPFAGAVGLSAGELQGLNAIQGMAFGANPLTNIVNQQLQQIAGSGGIHPQLDQLIGAATRPIIDQFGDEQLAQRGAFTAAGHQIQGLGSSPFAQASARLSSGVANAIGDTTAQLTAALNQQQQQQQMQALGMGMQMPGLQLQNQLAGLQALGLPREIAQMGLNQQSQAFENQQGRQLQAGSSIGQQGLAGQAAQMQAQLQNLQAQGLPRLIEQLGIDAGLQEYQRQQQQMMQLMQLMSGVSAPNTVALPGTPGSTGALGAFAGGFGSALGGGLFGG